MQNFVLPSLAICAAFAFAAPLLTHASENAPDFTLKTARGDFTLSQQRGRAVVLFFGYTHCSDVCPTTLAKLAHTIRARGLAGSVRVAFVTVDPRRDTAAALARYVQLFDSNFVGLTGDPRRLDSVFDLYHVWSKALPANARSTDYAVAHSTATYFIDRTGRLRGVGDWDDSQAALDREFAQYFS